jgi:hypothetical protein
MTIPERMQAARAAGLFAEAVAAMVCDDEDGRERLLATFPPYPGLGTDGGCWTDDEHYRYCTAVAKRAVKLLRPKLTKPPA